MTRRILGYGSLALLLLVITVPWWLPLGRFVPEIEQRASHALGRPVRVGSLSLRLLPRPQLVIRDSSVGEEPLLVLPEVRVLPKLSTLWQPTRVIEQVRVLAPRLDAGVFQALGALGQGDAGPQPSAVLVQRVVIEDAQLHWSGGSLSGLDAQLSLGENHALTQAGLSLDQGRLNLSVKPRDGDYVLQLEGQDWALPVGPAMRFNALQASAVLGKEGLVVEPIKARLYGGELSGAAHISWARDARLSGRFVATRLDLQGLLAVLRPKTPVSGRLSAEGRFTGSGRTLSTAARQLTLSADFRVEQGVLRGVDLVGAVKKLVGADGKPGDTAFDRLQGHVEYGPSGTRLSKVEMESGLLSADGALSVAADKTLDGEARVSLKGTASLVGTPTLIIAGTADAPKVYPSKSVVAGAAVGTAILGPGLGTSIGMKAGELARKLFSSGTPAKPQAKPIPGR